MIFCGAWQGTPASILQIRLTSDLHRANELPPAVLISVKLSVYSHQLLLAFLLQLPLFQGLLLVTKPASLSIPDVELTFYKWMSGSRHLTAAHQRPNHHAFALWSFQTTLFWATKRFFCTERFTGVAPARCFAPV